MSARRELTVICCENAMASQWDWRTWQVWPVCNRICAKSQISFMRAHNLSFYFCETFIGENLYAVHSFPFSSVRRLWSTRPKQGKHTFLSLFSPRVPHCAFFTYIPHSSIFCVPVKCFLFCRWWRLKDFLFITIYFIYRLISH